MYRDESCPIVLQMDGVLRGSVRTPVEKSIARREVLAGGSDVSWKDGGIRILSPDVRFGTTDSPAANRCPCPGALRLEYERHRRKKRSVWKQAFLGQAASLPPRAFSPAAPRLTQARRHAGTQRAQPAPRVLPHSASHPPARSGQSPRRVLSSSPARSGQSPRRVPCGPPRLDVNSRRQAPSPQRTHAIGRPEGGRPGGGPASSAGPGMAR
jgi:hypothetical protein